MTHHLDISLQHDQSLRTTVSGHRTVVIDNGTGLVKAGFAGDTLPPVVFPCIVGRPTLQHKSYRKLGEPSASKDVVVGWECTAQKHQLGVSYPMRNGVVQSWEDMQHVWDHTFEEQLQVDPTECKVLLTDPALNPVANRHKMLETMFEKYGVAGANMQIQAILTLYAQGLLSGLVMDSGDGVSHAVAVVDGFIFPRVTKRLNVAGRHVTAHLLELLHRRGYNLNRSSDFDSVREVKEALCYVAIDQQREVQLARSTTYLTKTYTLPDGRTISVGPERFMAPEAMFNPSLVDVEGPGIAEMAFNCIQEMDLDNRRCLYEHVVISGGSSMYPGLPTRMENEMRQLYLSRVLKGDKAGLKRLKLKIMDPPNRKHMVFLGGAILADIMKDQPEFWISKQDFAECPHRAMQKCGLA